MLLKNDHEILESYIECRLPLLINGMPKAKAVERAGSNVGDKITIDDLQTVWLSWRRATRDGKHQAGAQKWRPFRRLRLKDMCGWRRLFNWPIDQNISETKSALKLKRPALPTCRRKPLQQVT